MHPSRDEVTGDLGDSSHLLQDRPWDLQEIGEKILGTPYMHSTVVLQFTKVLNQKLHAENVT